jgi:tRNA dimethylallyltransferase
MQPSVHPLIVIAGPTASGKSHLALHLACLLDGELVNCDSLQLYRGFDIGTAKTPPAERRGVPHHLIDVLAPGAVSTAGDYVALARPVLADIARRGRLPLLTGGTGFYIRAVLDGLSPSPKRDNGLRARLEAREARRPGSLHRFLVRFDPVWASKVHQNDAQKTLRALEIALLARRPASQLFSGAPPEPLTGFRLLKLYLDPDRAQLRQKIQERTQFLFDSGLLDEVRGLLAAGVPPTAKPFESIGYKEALAVLAGRMSETEARAQTALQTAQYAKRQETWFRRESDWRRLPGFGDEEAVMSTAYDVVSSFLR